MNPHVLFVANRGGCTRVHKQAAALKPNGWRVDLLSTKVSEGWDVYGKIYGQERAADPTQWPALIESSEASIIHYHNEPDDLFRLVVDGAQGRPVVYDVHDLSLFKQGLTTDAEYAFQHASAVVHVSREVRDAAWSIFPHPAATIVVENYPLRSVCRGLPAARAKCGVVYVGGMVSAPSGGYWRHRYFKGVDAAFAEAGVDVTWVSRDAQWCGVRRPLTWQPYGAMLAEVARHSYGFVGSEVKRALQRLASPNKAWEYLALGLPLLALNQPRMQQVLGGKAGIYGETVAELVAGMKRSSWTRLHREALAARRWMEDEIAKVEELYLRLGG